MRDEPHSGRGPAPAPPIPPWPVPLQGTFDDLYGLQFQDDPGDGTMRGRVTIRDELRQPDGLLHGGVLASVAEALASWGTWRGAGGEGVMVMGMSNDTNFLRPFLEGDVHAVALPRHRGRTRWLWDVEFRDDEGRLGATTRVNIAVRPARAD